jgi:hypothetical protein
VIAPLVAKRLTHREVIAALVANRLTGPRPLHGVMGWAEAYASHDRLGVPASLLDDDRLGRALDATSGCLMRWPARPPSPRSDTEVAIRAHS